MIKLFFANTPNVFKVMIALEELGLANERIPVELTKGEQFNPDFLKVNPNNKVPAIIDTTPANGGEPIRIFESGAILIYLAEKEKKLFPEDPRGRADVLQWVMWQMAGQGPMLGQLGHFMHHAPNPDPYALSRFNSEARRLYRILDTHLKSTEFIAGNYSIADIICWPWVVFRQHHSIELTEFPNVARWFAVIDARPMVQRAMANIVIPAPAKLSPDAHRILFHQSR